MSKRRAIRELSRTNPTPKAVQKILDGLRDKDDLHIAIIAVSIVEAALERLLVTRIKTTDKKFLDKLFQHMGPLSDFNSKILIGQAFGILTSPLADELHVMRDIRNAFAHAKIHMSFADKPIAAEVRRLKLAVASFNSETLGADGRVDIPEKASFLLAIRIALIVMAAISKKKSTADKVLERALLK